MNKVISMSLTFLLVFLAFMPFGKQVEAQTQNERVLVLFKQQVDKKVIENANGKVNREYKNIPALAVSVPSTAIKGLEKNPNIALVEKDVAFHSLAQVQDWGIVKTNASLAWNSLLTGNGIKVAIVDTGIAAHEDLVIAGGTSFVSYTTSFADDNGHGTHVAGIVGARNNAIGTVGIAPDTNLYALKALDNNGSGYLADIVAAIDWSITNKMDIINLSLGSNYDSYSLKSIVDKAYQSNILVVAAAGNDGASDGSGDNVDFPARYDSVIAVGATDSNNFRGSFSSTGPAVEVAAPGVNVLSTYIGNRYVKMSGTSMATPYAVGNLALLKQQYPTYSASGLRILLQNNIIDLGLAGRDNWFGYGLIQAPVQTTVSEPINNVSYESITAVSTNKSAYSVGETISILVKVTDQSGTALANANVAITITNPKNKASKVTVKTDSNGNAVYNYSTNKSSAKGTYKVTAASTLTGYTSSSSSTTFSLR